MPTSSNVAEEFKGQQLEAEHQNAKDIIVTLENIKASDKECQFYTGFPNYDAFHALCNYLEENARKLEWWHGNVTFSSNSHHTKPDP